VVEVCEWSVVVVRRRRRRGRGVRTVGSSSEEEEEAWSRCANGRSAPHDDR